MPALEIHADWAKALAEGLVANGATPPTDLDDERRLALAWALKDGAIAAWSSAPAEIAVFSELLAVVCAHANANTTPISPSQIELDAIASFVAGVASIARGEMSGALNCLDRAAELFGRLALRKEAAHTQIPKIMVLSVLGRYSDAVESGVNALHTLTALGDIEAASRVNLNLGNLYAQRNENANALRHFQSAAEFFEGVSDYERTVSCETGIGDAHASMGNFDAALTTYAHALHRAESYALSVPVAVILESSALVHLARGNYHVALSGLERSRQQYEDLGLPQHQALAEKQLADAYLDLRLLPEALRLYDQALVRFNTLEMPAEEAWAHLQRGRVLAAMNRPFSTINGALQTADSLFTRQMNQVGRASVLLARAESALAQGEADDSFIFASEAVSVFATEMVQSERLRAEVVVGYALLLRDQAEAAAAQFTAALASSRALELTSTIVRCLVGIGLVHRRSEQTEMARQSFEGACQALEEQRAALPGDDLRSAFLHDQLRPYQELLRIALQNHRQQPSANTADETLVRLEQFRARALSDRLGETTRAIREESNENVDDAALRARRNWLYRRTQRLLDEGEDAQLLVDEVSRIERELLERSRRQRLTKSSPNSARPSLASGSDLQSLAFALSGNEALIEYGVLDDELFACAVVSGGVSVIRDIAKWSQVKQAVSAVRFQIEALCSSHESIERHHELLTQRLLKTVKRLHDMVWAPLSGALNGQRKILIVPHEQLGGVQFASLHDGQKYLAENYEFAVAPSAHIALRGLLRRPVTAHRVVVLGETTRLRYAAKEAHLVASLFPEALVLVDDSANVDTLRMHAASADVLHLACHGQFRSDNPMFSALHLVDAPFTVADAETLTLKQGIVVLSACETGVVEYSRGDEMMGLVRGFLIAGASRIVASLWPVDDATTMQFMDVFYRSLIAGSSPSAALRSAQRELMRTHPHPFHWAAFALYGGW